jgi:hypothetical protein
MVAKVSNEFAGYPGYVNTKFEKNMVDAIREARAELGGVDRAKISSDVLDRADARLDRAVDYMKSQGDGYTAAEKDNVRDFIGRANELIDAGQAEAAAYAPPAPPSAAPAPAPRQSASDWKAANPEPVRENYASDTSGDIQFAIDLYQWNSTYSTLLTLDHMAS